MCNMHCFMLIHQILFYRRHLNICVLLTVEQLTLLLINYFVLSFSIFTCPYPPTPTRFSTSGAKQWGNSTRCDSQCQIHIECGFTYHYMNEFDLCVREAQNRRSAEKTAATSPSLYISTADVALASFLSVLASI